MAGTSLILRDDYIVEKSNILNQMRGRNWTLQELRFLHIFLSKINPREPKKRSVQFLMSELINILELSEVREKDIRPVLHRLLHKDVEIRRYDAQGKPTGEYTIFLLFQVCEVKKNENNEWCVYFYANDMSMPLLFELKHYFKYKLFNVLHLKSTNQICMFNILKQYEKKGERTLPLVELRELLGIAPEEYTRWERFKTKILDVCQKALAEKTDIKFTYEPIKKGKGGKTSPVVAVKFIIEANDVTTAADEDDEYTVDGYRADMEYGGHIPGERPSDIDNNTADILQWLGSCVQFEFGWRDMSIILNIFGTENIPIGNIRTDSQIAAFLSGVYDEFLLQVEKKLKSTDPVQGRFYYFRGILKNKVKELSARLTSV